MPGSADLDKALNTAWDESGLNAKFNVLWASGVSSTYPVLNDQEATPGQPFPFCVFEKARGKTLSRMSRDSVSKWEVQEIPISFHVHANVVSGDNRSAKEIAADLTTEILKVFGGHPTVAPTKRELTLDNGHHLQTQHQNDFGTRTGDDQYEWIINYVFLVDVPIMV